MRLMGGAVSKSVLHSALSGAATTGVESQLWTSDSRDKAVENKWR